MFFRNYSFVLLLFRIYFDYSLEDVALVFACEFIFFELINSDLYLSARR